MLKKITISNFQSIGDKIEVSFDADTPIYIMLGANGSGKTAVLKAICFIFWFMNTNNRDDTDPLPVLPHMGLSTSITEFELEYSENYSDYKYVAKFEDQTLLAEGMWSRVGKGKYVRTFDISHGIDNTSIKKFSPALKESLNKNDLKRYSSLKNISFFAFLKSAGYFEILNITSHTINNLHNNISQLGRRHQPDGVRLHFALHNLLDREKDLQNFLITFLQELDYSITGFTFEDETVLSNETPKKVTTTNLKYKLDETEISLPLLFESEGTCSVISILIAMYDLEQNGGLFVWDELESSMHPLAAKKIISKLNQYSQSGRCQVLFTTHMNELLDEFDKKNIFLVEKSENLQTDVYALNDVKGVRKDENFADKYIGGIYGGTPNIKGVI